MIAHLKQRGVRVVFNSGAIGLMEKKRRGLIDSGLDELRVSMDAAQVNVQRLVHYGQGLAVRDQSLYGTLSALEADMLAEATRLSQELGIHLSASGNARPEASLTPAERERPWSGCQQPWSLSYITANGNVLPCCVSPWTAKDYQGLIPWRCTRRTLRRDLERGALPEVPDRVRNLQGPRPVPGLR
jgi:hypothetical protein